MFKIGKLSMGLQISVEDISVIGPNTDTETIPEAQFFSRRNSGVDNSMYLPLPDGVEFWNEATYKGERVLVGAGSPDLYLIVDDANLGLSLYHYVYPDADRKTAKMSYDLPVRGLQNERSTTTMSGLQAMNLGNIANAAGAARMPMAPQAPLPGGETGDGVSYGSRGGAASPSLIAQVAKKRGYVAGYIMGSAPAISLSLAKTSKKDQADTYSIIAKESKPSRPLAVVMALPARCVMKGGTMATPTEIKNGLVDFNTIPETEMVYQTLPYSAAITYIAHLGQMLPEYAPTVSNARNQWTPDEILYGDPKVSFVVVKATANKSAAANTDERFKFALKSTSDRKSLYTRGNHVCMRALRHIPVTCKTEEDMFRLNEAAFGGWKYRQMKTSNVTALKNAINNCPSQIWEQEYTINGEIVSGIGSCFFMNGASIERPVERDGKTEMLTIPRQQLMYYPWYATGANRGAPEKVERMVERTLRPAEGDKKARMVTHPILYKDNPEDPAFAQYKSFVSLILRDNFIREDALKAMGGRAVRATTKSYTLSKDQMESLDSYMATDMVKQAIQSVQQEASTRAALKGQI